MVLNKLRSLFQGSHKPADPDGIYAYVKCGKCGTPLTIRADKRHDLQRDFDGDGYIWRKEVMDGKCFKLFYFTLHFDEAYHITDREIEGGEFISKEAYTRLTQSDGETTNQQG